jgi:hypothetical protein
MRSGEFEVVGRGEIANRAQEVNSQLKSRVERERKHSYQPLPVLPNTRFFEPEPTIPHPASIADMVGVLTDSQDNLVVVLTFLSGEYVLGERPGVFKDVHAGVEKSRE